MTELDNFKIDKVEKLEKVTQSVEAFKQYVRRQSPDGIPTERGYFESLMRQERKGIEGIPQQAAERNDEVGRKSLLEEVGKTEALTDPNKPSAYDLIAQAQSAVDRIETIKRDLASPELQIKNSVQRLLKNKLGDINSNLKAAFAKAGIEYVPPEQRGLRTNPMVNFLDMLAHGQTNLEQIGQHVQMMSEEQKEIKPMDLLAVQIKVAHVQQELEFFSNLLNKSLESTKTLMNVQV